MRNIREVLRLAHAHAQSRRAIARSLGISRDAVADYLLRAASAGLAWPLPAELDDQQLERRLYPLEPSAAARRPLPDWSTVHRDMQRPGATLRQLHAEYLARHPDGMQRAQFCALYRAWSKHLKSYLRQAHVPGDKVFVDYAGPTIPIHGADGCVWRAQIFVATLGASNYTYAEAHTSQQLADWVAAHVRMLDFFGGVPNVIVCDNLKAAVTRASLSEPLLNDTYRHFAAHYGTAIVPARARHPKDKSKVEGHVLIVERWILFRLRNRLFTSLDEVNAAIRELLLDLNQRPFQKLPGNRASAFQALDRPALHSLPATPYEYVEFHRVRVGMDRMVNVDGRAFSAPPRLVEQVVDLRVTASVVELLHKGRRVASHVRTPGHDPVIDAAHMSDADRAYNGWSADREVEWARAIGMATLRFVEDRLESIAGNKTLGYRLGIGMRRLEREFGAARVEAACTLQVGATSVTRLRSILTKRLDLARPAVTEANFAHENVRGSGRYH